MGLTKKLLEDLDSWGVRELGGGHEGLSGKLLWWVHCLAQCMEDSKLIPQISFFPFPSASFKMGLSCSVWSFPGLALAGLRCPLCSQPFCLVSNRAQGDVGAIAFFPLLCTPHPVTSLQAYSTSNLCVCLCGIPLPSCPLLPRVLMSGKRHALLRLTYGAL